MPATHASPLPPEILFDDDDDFGEFEFAPTPPAPVLHFSPFPTAVAAKRPLPQKSHVSIGEGAEDDEWGDFVESSLSSDPSSFPPPPPISIDSDPFKKGWEKPSGAIPLSIFGVEDEEEPDPASSPPLPADKNVIFSSSAAGAVATPAKIGPGQGLGGGGIRDLIADLYGQTDKLGSGSGSCGTSASPDEGAGINGGGESDESGWEFKDAHSHMPGGDGAQVEVIENSLENIHGLSLPSGIYNDKRDTHALHDILNNVSDSFLDTMVYTDPISTGNHDTEEIKIENSLNPNLLFGDTNSLSSPAKETFFASMPPKENDAALGLGGGGTEDLIDNLYGQANKFGTARESAGTFTNGVSSDLGINNYGDDDFDGSSWEFKDALSDMDIGDGAQLEVVEKVDIHRENLPSGICNNLGHVGEVHVVHDTFNKASDLFSGAVLNTDSTSTIYDAEPITINDSPSTNFANGDTNSPPSTKNLFSSSMSHAKNGSGLPAMDIKDLIDDLYGQASNLGDSEDCTGIHSNGVSPDVGGNEDVDDDFDDSAWEFKDALSDMHSGKSAVAQVQDFGEQWGNDVGNLSSSTARNEKQEPGNLLSTQNKYFVEEVHLNSAPMFDGSLLNLDDTAGQTTAVQFPPHSMEDRQDSCRPTVNFNATNSADIFYENSWEVKNDIMGNGVKDQISMPINTSEVILIKPTPECLMDFYTKLRHISQLLTLKHLDDLKKAYEIAALSGDEVKVLSLHQEIEAAYATPRAEELAENAYTGEDLKNVSINELLESMKEPYFQALEMEYFLSERISLAEENLSSAIHLFNHAILMLRFFNVASWEEQLTYIRAWSKLSSACGQELLHGAMIWQQCLLANIQKQILSEPRGYAYFLALGEIYRVVEVLSASLAVYKPWLLANPAESKDLLICVKKCSDSWVDSGLKKALECISGLADSINKEIESLLESITFIHNLDILAIQNCLYGHGEPLCQLSLLPLGTLQDMKPVVWNEKKYFVKLANLWANRVSSDPPELPYKNAG